MPSASHQRAIRKPSESHQKAIRKPSATLANYTCGECTSLWHVVRQVDQTVQAAALNNGSRRIKGKPNSMAYAD
jgi:hypothetical protein